MICLRSGYCCTHLEVIIIDDPTKGIVDGNLIPKPTGEKCKHLQGNKPGEHSCAIHNMEWYNETPCAQHSQVEVGNKNCRIGDFIVNKKNM